MPPWEQRKALDFYEQALPLMRQVGDRGGEAATLNNIGMVYSALGDQRKALDFYEQALPLIRQVGDRGGEATTLNNIGGVYDDLGEKRKALDFFEQALPLIARWATGAARRPPSTTSAGSIPPWATSARRWTSMSRRCRLAAGGRPGRRVDDAQQHRRGL